jgi:membrane protease YdiL (CAAX protease family)
VPASRTAGGPPPERQRPKPVATPPRGFLGYLRHRHDPLTSLVLTVPVFLFYHLRILLIDLRNGVDLVSELTFALLEQSVLAYVGVTVGIAAALFGAGWWMRKSGRIRPARLLPVLGESAILAVVMMLTVGWATGQVFANQVGGRSLNVLEKLVMAAGAGFHEELVFRVGLFAGGMFLLTKTKKLGEWGAFAVAALASSLVFSAVHYVGSMSDDFTFVSFTFRTLAGLFLVGVYRLRGFAVAVYTHAIYDVLVFFL